MKNLKEREQATVRSVALLNHLASRFGADSHYQFAAIYDESMPDAASSQASGKWRPYFVGERPLPFKLLALLETAFPGAIEFYRQGPKGLWQAMWGPADCLRLPISNELSEFGSFDQALAEFEGELLLAEQYRAPLCLEHLSKAVALYRLHYDLLGLDGEGACRCIRLCLDSDEVCFGLRELGVRQSVETELDAWIMTRLDCEVAWANATHRWEQIAPRLQWVD